MHYFLSICLGLWDLHCVPLQRLRATFELRCALPTCVVHFGAQGRPNFFRSSRTQAMFDGSLMAYSLLAIIYQTAVQGYLFALCAIHSVIGLG